MCDFANSSVVMELVNSVLSLTALQLNFFCLPRLVCELMP
jgi:hypothetical protein